MSDQERISHYNINQISDENKGKFKLKKKVQINYKNKRILLQMDRQMWDLRDAKLGNKYTGKVKWRLAAAKEISVV